MFGSKTYIRISKVVIGCLVLCVMVGCCRKQYDYHHSAIRLENQKTIDNYMYRGIAVIHYDTTVIIVNEIGDTLRTDHRERTDTYHEREQRQDSIVYVTNDSIVHVTETIVKNELNKPQRFFFLFGIGAMVLIIGWCILKILKTLRVL